jgi:replicative DNA helicase
MVMIKDGADEESYTMVKNTIQAFEEVRKENLFLYDNKLTLGQIVSEIRMLKKKHGVELFYIDYL